MLQVVTPADDAVPTFFLTEIIRVFFVARQSHFFPCDRLTVLLRCCDGVCVASGITDPLTTPVALLTATPIAHTAGDLYAQMPEIKAKFRNVAVESRGFASMMQHVILRPFDGVDTELIRSIGLQHIAQGITEEMYVAMAKSVLVLFHKRLPEGEYTAEVQEAFLASFCTAGAYMLNANTAKYVKRKLVNTYNNLFRQILGSAANTSESSESFTNRFTGFMRSGRSRNNTNARGGKDYPSQAAADLNSCSDNNLLRGGISYPIEMDSAVLNRAGSNPTMTNGGLSSTSSLGEPIDSDSTFSPRQKLTEFFSSSRRGSKSKITKGLVAGPSDSTAPETTNNLSPHRHKLSRTNSSLLGGSTSPTMRKSTSAVSLSDLLSESERGGEYSSNPSTPVTVFADNDRGARQRIGSPLRARSKTKFSSTISNNSPLISNNSPLISNNSPLISNNSPLISNNSPLISNNSPLISTAYTGTSVWEHNDLYQGQDDVLPVDRSG
ncbi:hypothetical protein SARC_04459 [Sphaeroforma arctica JP610]|uniref:Globin family profile domain-containing protein n=1 Tax=Sphaeroforma arctica JP610 TaxID=667725 RepID=A0A0L0G2I2_9EUKA|nr:hypothetical protein SARC_04459 [Sphaeroforma arctica JP610]KNC83280.1 hypothetical protein SARC_04459 [Sphaeroforma arctica JP610]|eukprot:XP_014157182.1 hypothetical protein SARC_04459 [Sphaeroforma arctica JP610]